jgi:hypothetical protein
MRDRVASDAAQTEIRWTMAVCDQDFELLEALYDGELSAEEAAEMHRRIESEPELAEVAALARNDRELRVAAFASYEPDDAVADGFATRVLASLRTGLRLGGRVHRFAGLKYQVRPAVAAAALLLIGFGIGWMGRGGGDVVLPTVDAGPAEVALTDSTGQVMAIQKFQDPQQAQDFTDDLRRWRVWEQINREQQQVQPPPQHQKFRSGNLTYTADEF